MTQEPGIEPAVEVAGQIHRHLILHGDDGRHTGGHQPGRETDEGLGLLVTPARPLAGLEIEQPWQRVGGGPVPDQGIVAHQVRVPGRVLEEQTRRPGGAVAARSVGPVTDEMDEVMAAHQGAQALEAGRARMDAAAARHQGRRDGIAESALTWQDPQLQRALVHQGGEGLPEVGDLAVRLYRCQPPVSEVRRVRDRDQQTRGLLREGRWRGRLQAHVAREGGRLVDGDGHGGALAGDGKTLPAQGLELAGVRVDLDAQT